MSTVNYDDERFGEVENQKQQALSEVEKTYGNMIGQSDQFYQAQIDASKEWGDTQQQIQQANTDFAIEQINQQKEQAEKDYQKEQSGAYVDWQKESNRYGANAEQMAASGLTQTGYGESSQLSMYNTYQNRVAMARESYNQAVLNYDNAIKEAQLQNNAAMAEIAFRTLQTQLELGLQGFQYKNALLAEQLNAKQTVDNTYYSRYQDVLAQINQENVLAEEQRQFDIENGIGQIGGGSSKDVFVFGVDEAEVDEEKTSGFGGLDISPQREVSKMNDIYKTAYSKKSLEELTNHFAKLIRDGKISRMQADNMIDKIAAEKGW
jgi:hypothetical protein